MKFMNHGLIAGALIGALSVSACATKQDIADAVGPVDARTQANAANLDRTQSQVGQLNGQVGQLDTRVGALAGQVNDVSATAREALNRANAAGVLAEGKFLYSVMLSDDSVKFPANSSTLSPEAMARLDELAARLRAENRNVFLEIQGYTDGTGSPQTNERMGQQRAEAVRRYLNSKGVPLNRISTISYGETNPVAPNNTRQGRAQNRRVVIQVLS